MPIIDPGSKLSIRGVKITLATVRLAYRPGSGLQMVLECSYYYGSKPRTPKPLLALIMSVLTARQVAWQARIEQIIDPGV